MKSDSLSLFCRLFCRFFAFFSNFLWFSDLQIFLFGRNPSTFVRLRPFLPDVTQLTHHQHDGIMPIISFLVFVYFKVQKKLFFVFQKATKKRQKKRQKNDKTPTNTLIKTGNSKKATVVVIFFGLSVPPQVKSQRVISYSAVFLAASISRAVPAKNPQPKRNL